jgi:hypothetical protein
MLTGSSIAAAGPAAYDWSGVYFGLGVGYGSGSTTATPDLWSGIFWPKPSIVEP